MKRILHGRDTWGTQLIVVSRPSVQDGGGRHVAILAKLKDGRRVSEIEKRQLDKFEILGGYDASQLRRTPVIALYEHCYLLSLAMPSL